MSEWYYSHDGAQQGPVPASELERLAADGEFDPENDLVWREGMSDWKPADTVEELAIGKPAPEPAAPEQSESLEPSEPFGGGGTPSPATSTPAAPAPAETVPPAGPPKTGLALTSLICGIIGIPGIYFCVGPLLSIAAVITGHMASSKAKREPSAYAGRGMALAGLITGYLGILITVALIAICIYVASIAVNEPARFQEMDWLPENIREQISEQIEQQRGSQQPQP